MVHVYWGCYSPDTDLIIISVVLVVIIFVFTQKRDDFRYAAGPSYCISEALMMKVEKYMR